MSDRRGRPVGGNAGEAIAAWSDVAVSRRTLLGMAAITVSGWFLPAGVGGRRRAFARPGASGPRIAVVPFRREMLRVPHPWAG